MNILKKILSVWIIIYLVVVPPFAHAASAGGWSFSSFDVATSVVKAMKNGASASVAVAKSPITAKIAKGIVGGAIAGAALPLAISQISGIALEAVDWVLDPANNAVKYKEKGATTEFYNCSGYWVNPPVDTPKAAYEMFVKKSGQKPVSYQVNSRGEVTVIYADNSKSVIAGCSVRAADYKTIPIPTLADKIYDNAKTDTESRSIVTDAVKEYVNEGSADVALDAAKADADATHNCGTGTHWSGSACVADTPSTPTTPTTPDTPFDPTSIIDAIGKVFDAVMSLPDVINNALDDLLADIKDFFQPVIDSFTDFVDWVKATPQDTGNDEVVVTDSSTPPFDIDTLALKPYISLPAECPANPAWQFMGGQIVLPLNIVCDGFSMASWLVMAFAWLRGLVIVGSTFKG